MIKQFKKIYMKSLLVSVCMSVEVGSKYNSCQLKLYFLFNFVAMMMMKSVLVSNVWTDVLWVVDVGVESDSH